MKIKLISIFILIFLLNITNAFSGSFLNLRSERDQKAREILEQTSMWFITEGVAKYYQGTDIATIESHIQKNGAHLSTNAVIESKDELAEIIIEYYWVGNWVSCITRLKSDGKIYEYWVIKTSSRRSDVRENEMNFMITQANSIEQKREIIFRANKFFSKYLLPNGKYINFPLNDNSKIFRLKPWNFPKAYLGTELENVEIIFQNNEYIKIQK